MRKQGLSQLARRFVGADLCVRPGWVASKRADTQVRPYRSNLPDGRATAPEITVVSQYQFSSVLPLCSLCLCGEFIKQTSTTETQRPRRTRRDFQNAPLLKLPPYWSHRARVLSYDLPPITPFVIVRTLTFGESYEYYCLETKPRVAGRYDSLFRKIYCLVFCMRFMLRR